MNFIPIRPERPEDIGSIQTLIAGAFPTDAEARLVAALRAAGRLSVSLVAEVDGQIVGHVAFSPVLVSAERPIDLPASGAGEGPVALGLAPLSVAEAFRRRGIGAELVRAGIEACRAAGAGFVVVLGDPHYYGRFGFGPARAVGLIDEYGGGDAFQLLELHPGSVPQGGGTVRYAPEFSVLE